MDIFLPPLSRFFGDPPFSGYYEEGLQQAQLNKSCVQEVKAKFIIRRYWPAKFIKRISSNIAGSTLSFKHFRVNNIQRIVSTLCVGELLTKHYEETLSEILKNEMFWRNSGGKHVSDSSEICLYQFGSAV